MKVNEIIINEDGILKAGLQKTLQLLSRTKKPKVTGLVKPVGSVLQKSIRPMASLVEKSLGSAFVYDHYNKLKNIDEEYELYKLGDRSTELFGDLDENAAYQKYISTRNQLIGESVIVAANTLKVTSKAFELLRSLMGISGGVVGGAVAGVGGGVLGTMFGRMSGSLLVGLSKLVQWGPTNAATILFLNSDSGREFLSHSFVQYITNGVGGATQPIYDLGLQALTKAGVIDKAPTQEEPPEKVSDNSKKTPEQIEIERIFSKHPMVITFDDDNPNIMYWGKGGWRQPMTDAEGYQVTREASVKDFLNRARTVNTSIDLNKYIKRRGGTKWS